MPQILYQMLYTKVAIILEDIIQRHGLFIKEQI